MQKIKNQLIQLTEFFQISNNLTEEINKLTLKVLPWLIIFIPQIFEANPNLKEFMELINSFGKYKETIASTMVSLFFQTCFYFNIM